MEEEKKADEARKKASLAAEETQPEDTQDVEEAAVSTDKPLSEIEAGETQTDEPESEATQNIEPETVETSTDEPESDKKE